MALWQIVGLTLFCILLLYVLLSAVSLFFEERSPQSAWAWMLALLFFPVFGILFFLIFGREGKRQKAFRQKAKQDAEGIWQVYFAKEPPKVTADSPLMMMHLRTGSLPVGAEKITLFTEGEAKVKVLFDDIEKAQETVNIQYYILRNDEIGRAFLDLLTKKAAEGIGVRLLYDAMGCHKLPKNFFLPLVQAGGQVAAFTAPFFLRINFRNHRKICVVDGIIGYIGGFNIGEEYLGHTKRYGHWRDTHLRLFGDAAKLLELRFLLDWQFASGKTVDFPKLPEGVCGAPVQVVSSGPDVKWQTLRNGYFSIINSAQSHIYLATPYFAPDEAVFTALETAALSGILVHIMFPMHPDHPFVYGASLSCGRALLAAGVKLYAYTDGFLHSKALSVDGKICTLGTANMDVRSFRLNFETNVFVYDSTVAQGFEESFLADVKDCISITEEFFEEAGTGLRLKMAVGRLMSPLV